jgi:general secretion pathway protein H
MRGFTLLEILVVMVIIGIALAMVSVNLGRDDRRILRDDAERLAALLEHAEEEALVSGTTLAWSPSAGGYRFWRYDEDRKWVPVSGDEIFRERALEQGVSIAELRINQALAKPQDKVLFVPGGVNLTFEATLALGSARVVVSGDALGRVSVKVGGGEA